MDGVACGVRSIVVWVILGTCLSPSTAGEPATEDDAIVVRLVHPERQASEVLRLFDGARWSDPAAALAAWKRHTPETGLGKVVEAAIATFNPEMAAEWRCLDEAEVRIGFDPRIGEPGWLAIIPRDDGTVAASLTAMH